MHALRQHLLTQPRGGDLDRGRGAQIQPALCGDTVQAVAQQVHPGLQVGHPHPQRLVLEQRRAELSAPHHAGVGDPEDALTRRRHLTRDRHAFVCQTPRDGRQPGAGAGDEMVGGHPGVDVHGGGVQRTGADLAPRWLHLDLRGGHGDDEDVAVPAGGVVVHAAGDDHDVIGDGGQGHELLDAPYLETLTGGTRLGLDDLKIRTAGLFGRADAQHGLAVDGLFADVSEVLGPAEPAQDRDRRVVQAHTYPDTGGPQPAQAECQLVEFGDVGVLAALRTPLRAEHPR